MGRPRRSSVIRGDAGTRGWYAGPSDPATVGVSAPGSSGSWRLGLVGGRGCGLGDGLGPRLGSDLGLRRGDGRGRSGLGLGRRLGLGLLASRRRLGLGASGSSRSRPRGSGRISAVDSARPAPPRARARTAASAGTAARRVGRRLGRRCRDTGEAQLRPTVRARHHGHVDGAGPREPHHQAADAHDEVQQLVPEADGIRRDAEPPTVEQAQGEQDERRGAQPDEHAVPMRPRHAERGMQRHRPTHEMEHVVRVTRQQQRRAPRDGGRPDDGVGYEPEQPEGHEHDAHAKGPREPGIGGRATRHVPPQRGGASGA